MQSRPKQQPVVRRLIFSFRISHEVDEILGEMSKLDIRWIPGGYTT